MATAPWSKLALDGLMLLTALMVLVFIQPHSFFELLGSYITIPGFIITLGAFWISQCAESLQSRTFPSEAFFGMCSVYILLGSDF